MANVTLALHQLRNRRNLTQDQHNSTLVFIGDSITLRVYNAANSRKSASARFVPHRPCFLLSHSTTDIRSCMLTWPHEPH